jgi:cholesterol oxidase
VTSVIRIPDQEDGGEGRGFYVELSEELEIDVGAEVSRLFGNCEHSAGTFPMVDVGRDIPDGIMRLRGEKLDVNGVPKTLRTTL